MLKTKRWGKIETYFGCTAVQFNTKLVINTKQLHILIYSVLAFNYYYFRSFHTAFYYSIGVYFCRV